MYQQSNYCLTSTITTITSATTITTTSATTATITSSTNRTITSSSSSSAAFYPCVTLFGCW